jgi:hypothetical protein
MNRLMHDKKFPAATIHGTDLSCKSKAKCPDTSRAPIGCHGWGHMLITLVPWSVPSLYRGTIYVIIYVYDAET